MIKELDGPGQVYHIIVAIKRLSPIFIAQICRVPCAQLRESAVCFLLLVLRMLSCTLLYLLVAYFIPRGRSAPTPETQHAVGWVKDPDGRGTFSLLVSCAVTLGLCVWSALHLNIPPKRKSRGGRAWYYTKWIILGILIPELVILSAWRQWLSARKMTSEMKRILEDESLLGRVYTQVQPPPMHLPFSHLQDKEASVSALERLPRHEWTRVHSLYAGMGGFAFDAGQLPQGQDAFVPHIDRLHLSPLGVLLLAKCGLLPNLSLQEIKDKSKADGLAKTIVIFQAGWMVVQTIGRVWSRLPVTLLEVNTMGHVICAMIIYLLWWSKPKEVNEPTIIQGPDMPLLCSFFYMSSRVSGQKPDRYVKLSKWTIPELDQYEWSGFKPRESSKAIPQSLKSRSSNLHDKERHNSYDHDCVLSKLDNRTAQGQLQKIVDADIAIRKLAIRYLPVPDDTEHKVEIRRVLASQALQKFPMLREQIIEGSPISSQTSQRFTSQQLVEEEASDWPSDYYLPGLDGQMMGTVLWLTAMIYGAVHAAAWHDYFPTRAERLLWRFSAVYITSGSAAWLSVNMLAIKSTWASVWWDDFVGLGKPWWQYAFWIPVASVCGLAYVFARVFLVVGAVASLRSLEKRAYDTPEWSTSIPHF